MKGRTGNKIVEDSTMFFGRDCPLPDDPNITADDIFSTAVPDLVESRGYGSPVRVLSEPCRRDETAAPATYRRFFEIERLLMDFVCESPCELRITHSVPTLQ